MTRHPQLLLALALLALAVPFAAQDAGETPLDRTYYLNDASIAFDYNAAWTVTEIEPRGSVIVADSRETLTDFVADPGDFQMSIFSPSYVEPIFGDDLERALTGLLGLYFAGVQVGTVAETTVGGRPALRREYVDAGNADGFIIAFELPDGSPAISTVSVPLGALDVVEADLLALLASVERQALTDLPLEPFTTGPLGPQESRFTLDVPAGWVVEQRGLRVLATNAASLDAFSAAPGEFLLVVSPRYQRNISAVNRPRLEQNILPDGLDPLTAALATDTLPGDEATADANAPAYVVANRWNDPLVALVRVLHAPGEADAALAIALAVRVSIVPALPDGLVLADLPVLNFVAGVDPDWHVSLNQGEAMLITPVPVEIMTETDWAVVISTTRYNDLETTWETFLEQTDFVGAEAQSGQLPNGQVVFRATFPDDPTAPIRWAITAGRGQQVFLVSIFSPGGDNRATEDLLEPTLTSLRLR